MTPSPKKRVPKEVCWYCKGTKRIRMSRVGIADPMWRKCDVCAPEAPRDIQILRMFRSNCSLSEFLSFLRPEDLPTPPSRGTLEKLRDAVVKAAMKVSVFGGENYKGWGHALNELDDLVRACAHLELFNRSKKRKSHAR